MTNHKHVVMVPFEDYQKLVDCALPATGLVQKLCCEFMIGLAHHIERVGTLNGKEFADFLLKDSTHASIIKEWKDSIKNLKL